MLLSLKLAQGSRKRPLQLRSPLQDYHPVAGIHPEESPASSLAELQLTTPPPTSSHVWPFFSLNKEPQAICLSRRNPIWCWTDGSLLHIPKCIVLIPLSWKLFCTVCIVYVCFVLFYFDRSTLCNSIYMVQDLPFAPVIYTTCRKGYKDQVLHFISADWSSPNLLRQHKLSLIIQAVSRTHAVWTHLACMSGQYCMNVTRTMTVFFFSFI